MLLLIILGTKKRTPLNVSLYSGRRTPTITVSCDKAVSEARAHVIAAVRMIVKRFQIDAETDYRRRSSKRPGSWYGNSQKRRRKTRGINIEDSNAAEKSRGAIPCKAKDVTARGAAKAVTTPVAGGSDCGESVRAKATAEKKGTASTNESFGWLGRAFWSALSGSSR